VAAALKIEIARVSWNLVWIVAAFEGITVALLPYFATLQPQEPISKPPESGFLLGYIGMLTAALLVNAFSGRIAALRAPDGPLRFRNPLLTSLWGGIFLALVFWLQPIFDFPPDTVLNTMLRAAAALAGGTLIVLLLYRWSANLWPALSIKVSIGGKSKRIARTSIWPLVVFASLFEALALPAIELVRDFEHTRFLAGLFLGSVAGAGATAIVVLTYNTLSRSFPEARLHFIVE